MNARHNKGKSGVAERFIRILKNKIYKYMTSISKNMYIDKLDDILNKYINTYHSTIKMQLMYIQGYILISTERRTKKILSLKLVIMKNIKT